MLSKHPSPRRSRPLTAAGAAVLAGGALVVAGLGGTASATPRSTAPVLLVGTFNGHAGQYTSIQAAVNAAKPGQWILIAPGDYHETDDLSYPPTSTEAAEGYMGGVLVTTPNIRLRGMNRNTVIVDGTKSSAPVPCDSAAQYQQYGTSGPKGPYGRDGIVIWKANHVEVDNLTVCNFLAGTGAAGNEVWWNGGSGSGKIGLTGYVGQYLTATSTFFSTESTAAQYGIFSSDSAGPAYWNQLYANNFNDSGMYVGACKQVCDILINHANMFNNALGYSGTNSGGQIIIMHSVFEGNEDGVDTNTAISGDPTAPQNGGCPNGGISKITHTHSCWVFMDNLLAYNNNPNTPRAGSAAAGPTGTGMTISGGRGDTVMNNRFANNGAWGILFVPYPDQGTPVNGQTCTGSGGHEISGLGCLFDPWDDALIGNRFVNDGFFKNPTNSDFGQIDLFGGEPQNCFSKNIDPQGSAPTNLQQAQPTCGAITKSNNTGGPLVGQVLCDTGFGSCPKGSHYPTPTGVKLTTVPKDLPTMPNPCAGVPVNAWCPNGRPIGPVHGGHHGSHGSGSALPVGVAVVAVGGIASPRLLRRRVRA
jgi:hypothetical protein